ncbi:MAG TPA: FAD:protein FMN transferase [Verrucomicrobiae bacterium]|nr:FAD:protein FMN transferase [Verrucomicrobiae bacterium]
MSGAVKSNLQIIFVSIFTLAGCRSADPRHMARYEFSKPQMGAPFRIVLYAPDAAAAETAANAAFRRVETLNQIFSDYETDSELNELSRTAGSGKAVPVSNDLWRILLQSQRFSELSDGTFDVTVGPCVNLWRKARRDKKLPDPPRLAAALRAVGYKKLALRKHTARLLVPDMKLDLGGIAKGYAVDEAMKVLKHNGIRSALVGAAGDIAVSDPPPAKSGWQIEIGSPPKILSLSHAAVSTSGDTFQHLEVDGVRYSHIVDPRTGMGITNQVTVSVIARDSTTADALATAISVLGPEKGTALAKHFPGVSVYYGDVSR